MLENKIAETISDSNGQYNFGNVNCDTKLKIRASKDKYSTNEISVNVPKESGETQSKIALDLIEKPIKKGDDLRKTLGIKIIYFDLDKSNIRKDAAVELAKIVEIMKQYPKMEIDVRSHTDCRQTEKYNLELSNRRAKSTIQWLVKNGIEQNRITGKGYGESQLLNNCQCEQTIQSDCSEEEHQKNRRSEFIVLKVE